MMLISNYGMPDSSKETSPAAFDPGADFAITRLTDTQRELVEKFNCAFYEAQGGMRTAELAADEILETFDETYFTNIEKYDETSTSTQNVDGENYLLDYLIAKNDEGFEELVTPSSDCTSTFDYDEFSENFEQFNQPSYTNLNDYNEVSYHEEMNQFYVTPPFDPPRTYDIDISSSTSDGDSVYYPNYEYRLPPVTTIKNNIDFTNFIRQDATSLKFQKTSSQTSGNFGHVVDSDYLEDDPDDNQLILTQSQSLIYDDPMIGGSTKRRRKYTTGSDASTDCEEVFPPVNLQCKWENCYEIYESQSTLVRHIEKSHVELKRGEEFTCFWVNCPRKNKPFNARYKLLIHMRVHSGEKPNKCQFKGCNKAFSRLENLKIHQRSHTGERPYLCQFPNCTKSFSNSSDRAKHQRTHYDTKPYACQVYGCVKKYTDPSSLRKHIKNHSLEEQLQVKNKCSAEAVRVKEEPGQTKKFTAKRTERPPPQMKTVYANLDHSYSHSASMSVKQDLKNRLSEKINKNAALYN